MIIVNGVNYDSVGISNLQRSVKRDYKYDVTTEDGIRHMETRAIYPVYTVTFGSISDQATYDSIRAALNNYSETCEVTLPDGQDTITFTAVADIGSDAIECIYPDGTVRWDNMVVTFTGVEPIPADE